MTHRCMLLVYGLLGASLPMGGVQAQQPPVLHIAAAGTIPE
jgi:hypothetical protein